MALLLLGLILILLGIRQFIINKRRVAEGVITMAKVTRMIEYPRQRFGPFYRPLVEFTTQKGQTVTVELENVEQPNYNIGDQIEVQYHPDKPNEVTTSAALPNNVAPLAFTAAGVVCLGIALSPLVLTLIDRLTGK